MMATASSSDDNEDVVICHARFLHEDPVEPDERRSVQRGQFIASVSGVERRLDRSIQALFRREEHADALKRHRRVARELVYRRCAWLGRPYQEERASDQMYKLYQRLLRECVENAKQTRAFWEPTLVVEEGIRGQSPRADDNYDATLTLDRIADTIKDLRFAFSYLDEYHVPRKYAKTLTEEDGRQEGVAISARHALRKIYVELSEK